MRVVSYEAGRKKMQLPDECPYSGFDGSSGLLGLMENVGELPDDRHFVVEAEFVQF